MTKKYEFQTEEQYAIQTMPKEKLLSLGSSKFATSVSEGDLVRFVDGAIAEVWKIKGSTQGIHIHFNNGRLVSLKNYRGVLRAYDRDFTTGKIKIHTPKNWQYAKENFFMILTSHDKWRIK